MKEKLGFSVVEKSKYSLQGNRHVLQEKGGMIWEKETRTLLNQIDALADKRLIEICIFDEEDVALTCS